MEDVLISIIVTSYNQENYIAQAMDSILMQKRNFPIEIIASDDASTDGTPTILQKYADEHSFIKFISRKENVGISKNWYEALALSKGKYVTTLEGDDYWLDPSKLQKQLDFLSGNSDYVGVSHMRCLLDDEGKEYSFHTSDSGQEGKTFTPKRFLKGHTFSYTSTLHINIFKNSQYEYRELITQNRSIADFALCMLLLDAGKVYLMPDKMGAYRIATPKRNHKSYSSSKSVLTKYEDHLQVIGAAEKYFKGKYDFSTLYAAGSLFPMMHSIQNKQFKPYKKLQKTIPAKAKLIGVVLYPRMIFRLVYEKIKQKIKAVGS